jgi:hypothetical protein
MIAAVAALALVLAATDPCAPVEPRPALDPAAAEVYRAVAEDELSRGDSGAAAASYRAALAADPSDERSRAALAALCEARRADPYRRGLDLMDRGDCRGAATAFREVRDADRLPSAALLEGICRYELGEDRAAEAALRVAEDHPAHREEARFYLGLLALRAGDGASAAGLLEAARANPALDAAAAELARAARTQGRLVLSLLAEGGWDSNVNLAPTGEPALSPEADGLWALRAGAIWRPLPRRGAYLRASGLLHEPLRLGDYSVRGFDAGAGWRRRAGRGELLAEYTFASRTFGGSPYLTFHRLLATIDRRGERLSLGATLLARAESYASAWSAFDGTFARGELRAAVLVSPQVRLGLAYGVARQETRDPVLSYVEHGPRAELRAAPRGRWRLGLDLALARRAYDRFDPALETTRQDTYLDGSGWAERSLGGGWSLRLALDARRALSGVEALEYGKVVPSLGLGWVWGLP